MRHLTTKLPLLLATSATLITAQGVPTTGVPTVPTNTGTNPGAKCAAQKVLDQCIEIMKFQLDDCAPSDWDCLCTGNKNIVNCYTNCPEHPDRVNAEQLRTVYCANAKAYGTVTATPSPASRPSGLVPSSTMSGASTTTRSGGESKSGSGSGSGSGKDGSGSVEPTVSLSGLGASPSASQGMAAVKATGSWLVFLGLGLGVMF